MADKNRVDRSSTVRWVPVSLMDVPQTAQREKINWARVDYLVVNFDPDKLGLPEVNHRDGLYFVVEGMHRIEALRKMGWGDQQIQCVVYSDLTDQEMAEKFLSLNDKLAVSPLDQFRIAVNAGRSVECDIDRIVRHNGLHVGTSKGGGTVMAVAALKAVYYRGPGILNHALGIIRDAYGDPGLVSPVIRGIGLLCQRYGGGLDTGTAVLRLSNAHGGVGGLLNRAHTLKLRTGNALEHCVAAAAVDTINAGRGGKKLPSWWTADPEARAS
jgi:hypothetical protein